MSEKINDIIGIIVAGILTFLVFNIKLTPPETKTINLKTVVGVSTLTQEELKKLVYISHQKERQKIVSLKNTKKRKTKYKKSSSKRKKYKSAKKFKRKVYSTKKTKLAKAKAYSKIKLKEKKENQEKILKKSIFLPLSKEETTNLEGIQIPITYLEHLKEIIKSNYFYPKEAFDKNIQGNVVVKFTLNKYGKLVEARVIKYSSDILAQAALTTIRRCKFPPFPSDFEYDKVSFVVKLKYQILVNDL